MPRLPGSAQFVMYVGDYDANWHWRLLAKNGKTVADSGEGYASRAACRAAIVRVKRLVRIARVTVVTE